MHCEHRALALEIYTFGGAELVLELVGNRGKVGRLVGAFDRALWSQAMFETVEAGGRQMERRK